MLLLATLLSFSLATTPDVYQKIPDLKHPRMCDWVQIQEFLKKGKREELRLLDQAIDQGVKLYDYRCRARRFRLIGKHFWDRPQFEIVPMGCGEEEKECCVITYASFNQHYPEAVEKLRAQLEKVGFRGHFIYRIGGWPDLEGGSLALAHVPYAFKPCFFQEAKRLGYQNVLWLDCSMRPVRSLDEVFQQIASQGYFLYPSGTVLAPVCSKQAIEAFGLTEEDARTISSIAAGVMGLNVTHPKGAEALEMWMNAARNGLGFFSPRPEQNAFSIIVHLLGMQEREDARTLSWDKERLDEGVRFFIDYASVQ
ncbi:MAG TPA: hypothetical protein VGM34_01565 [Chlamydiales bacterium]|jgi:hypothetical protein